MSSIIEAKNGLTNIALKAVAINKDATLTNAEKINQLEALALQKKGHDNTLAIHARSNLLMGGGESLGSDYAFTASSGRAVKGLASPSFALSPEMQEGLFQSAKSGQNLTVTLKDAANSDATRGQLPAQYIGMVDRKFEPTRILDHIPSTPMTGAAVEFISHTTNAVGIGSPVITLGSAGTGGTFTAGTYFWKLTALNGGGETLGSNELTATLTANQGQAINWAAVTGANSYRLYRGVSAGAETALVAVITGGATITYTDLGAVGTNATVPRIDRTASAQTVHAGGQMPETSLVTTPSILMAKKIGIFTTVVDELLADYPTFAGYTNVELTRQLTDAENWQLLSGDGTGDNLLGLLNTVGTLSRMKTSTDTALDVLEHGITDLRTGPTMCEPDTIIIHPSTWSTIRTTKSSLGTYLLGDPGQTAVSEVWGIPVIVTTQITPGTVVLANLEIGAQAFIREGVVLAMTNSADSDFTGGKVKIRATERLTLGVTRPTAINILTGF